MALMVLTARRHDERDRDEMPRRRRQQMHAYGYQQYQPQPPVIVVTGMPGQQGGYGQQQAGYPPNYGGQLALPGAVEQPAYRDFRVVGENEEVLDPW